MGKLGTKIKAVMTAAVKIEANINNEAECAKANKTIEIKICLSSS